MDNVSQHPRIRAAACILRKGAEVLLVQHQKDGQEYWLFPGGGVNYGEHLRDAAVREVQEEVGLPVNISSLLFVAETIAPSGRHVIHVTFRAELLSDEELSVGGDERVTAAAWHPIHALGTMMFLPHVGQVLASGWNGTEFSVPSFIPCHWKELT